MSVCIFAWMVCVSALSFLHGEICTTQEPSIIIMVIIYQDVNFDCKQFSWTEDHRPANLLSPYILELDSFFFLFFFLQPKPCHKTAETVWQIWPAHPAWCRSCQCLSVHRRRWYRWILPVRSPPGHVLSHHICPAAWSWVAEWKQTVKPFSMSVPPLLRVSY